MAKKKFPVEFELDCIVRMGELKDKILFGIDERNKEFMSNVSKMLEKKADEKDVKRLWGVVISSILGTATLVIGIFIFFSNKVEKIYDFLKAVNQ